MKSADFKSFRYLNPFKVQCYETLGNIRSLLITDLSNKKYMSV